MATSRFLVATAILAGLAAPAAADAAKPGPRTAPAVVKPAGTPAPVKAAMSVANRYWKSTPCGGNVRVVARSALLPGMHRETDAWVTFDTPLGANNLAAPAATYRNCSLHLTRWRWPTAASMSQDWDILCTTVIHEVGHLHGRAHEDRRGSIMAPVFTDHSSVPSICRSTRPRAARG